jgi:hypothetical protein
LEETHRSSAPREAARREDVSTTLAESDSSCAVDLFKKIMDIVNRRTDSRQRGGFDAAKA